MEKAVAPHSSTFAQKIPWMEEPGRLQSMGSLESDTTEQLHFHFLLSCIGEGNGNPLQCSCLENPRDRGAWWAAIYGIAQSQTRLKRLSSSSRSRSSSRVHHKKCQVGCSTSWNQDCRNINNLRYADDTTLMAESEEELKSLLMKVKEHEKVGLKLNIQKTKILASSPIT